jgi:hypothetical protein
VKYGGFEFFGMYERAEGKAAQKKKPECLPNWVQKPFTDLATTKTST